jgi:hypothetical protein
MTAYLLDHSGQPVVISGQSVQSLAMGLGMVWGDDLLKSLSQTGGDPETMAAHVCNAAAQGLWEALPANHDREGVYEYVVLNHVSLAAAAEPAAGALLTKAFIHQDEDDPAPRADHKVPAVKQAAAPVQAVPITANTVPRGHVLLSTEELTRMIEAASHIPPIEVDINATLQQPGGRVKVVRDSNGQIYAIDREEQKTSGSRVTMPDPR